MAKNTITTPVKDGVKADNSGYSSNQIEKMVSSSVDGLINDEAASEGSLYSSAKIYSMLPEATKSGSPASISDASPVPIVSLSSVINAIQEGTGIPSPDNVRLISARNKVNITFEGTEYIRGIEFNLGDNIYGGTVNLTTGVLTITHKYQVFNYESDWRYESIAAGKNFYVACDSDIRIEQKFGDMICNASPVNANITSQRDTCFISTGRNLNFTWGDSLDISSAAAFKEYLQTNALSIEIVALLTTPLTVQLTPAEVLSLERGSNTITSDSGEVTITYKKLIG